MYLVLGGTALAVVALVAYLMWPRTPDHVLIVGDSVSDQSWEQLEAAFGSDTSLQSVTRSGFTTGQLVPPTVEAIAEREQAGHELERAIFLVGYNDVWLTGPDYEALGRMVEASSRYECAIWLTLPVRPGGEPPGIGDFDPAVGDQWNRRVTELVAEHDNLHLVTEWADKVEAAEPDTYLIPDGIHPNDAGKELLAQVMHDNLRSSCSRLL